ncbi:MAG: ABC transporter substrate-binding protein [Candidatus Methanomethylophilaceae archaeon]|nr:ABC transporter substrate-binding protein [Candidatus Methanomethylophilaceae archaeon]
MERKTLIIVGIAAVAVVLIALAAGVVLNNHGDDGPKELTVTDSRNRTVTVPGDLERILPLNSCSLELVSYFDSLNKVVALDSNDQITGNKTYTMVNKSFLEGLPKVDGSSYEAIIATSAQLIITSTIDAGQLDDLQSKTSIPVFAINADLEFGDEAWFDQIETLGKVLGEEKRGKEIADGVKDVISKITSKKVDGVKGYTCGMMFYGKGTFLKTSGDWLPFAYSGVENVMPSSTAGVGKQPYNTTIEQVMAKDFGYIFVDNSNKAAVIDEMKGYISDQGLSNDAIKNGDVYGVLTYKQWGTQFDAVLIDCLYVAKTVNPDAYSWDFVSEADKVLNLLYGSGFTYSDMVKNQDACGKIAL